jgi:RNA 2',3'-cyclic 3'-phosphodiesterase
VTCPARVGSDETLRLFCALRLPDAVLDAVEAWQVDLRGGRIVDRANLHITLAFLGHRPAGELDGIRRELREAASGAGPIVLEPVRYRETRSVGMIVLRDEEGRAAALARDLHERLERLGVYRREAREWLPHLTVLRFRTRPRLELDPPATGPFMPSDAAAYLSRLSPAGARYEVLETVPI